MDEQAVSGVPELHWRQNEHHFLQRRAAPERPTWFQSTGFHSQKITTTTIHEKKLRHEPITCLTAYDYATARLVDQAGIDMILVGDSLAQVVLGYDNTLPVTMEEMLHHTRAVRRAVRSAMVIADMPFGAYHEDEKDGVHNALRFVKEAGAEAVKLEGGAQRVGLVKRVLDAEVPGDGTHWVDAAVTA